MSNKITTQQVICSLTPLEDGTINIGITFEPGIAGTDDIAKKDYTEQDQHMQGYAAHIAASIMDALKVDKVEEVAITMEE